MRHYIIASPHVISEVASEETVVINLNTGSYYNLNAEASKLWALLVQGVDLDAVLATTTPDAVQKMETFFAELIQQGLITQATATASIPANFSVDASKLVFETYTDMQDLLGLDPIHEVEPQAGWPVQPSS